MKRVILAVLFSVQALSGVLVVAQDSFFTRWQDRVRKTSSQQPGWAVPVVAPSSGLVQLARIDVLHQWTSTHTSTWNYGNSKGFNFIPYYKTEVDVNLPPYVEHNTPKAVDGAGDFSMVVKYRPFAGGAEQGNYSTSFQVAATGATGSYKNGTARTTINPTLILGKGFGRFDVQSSLGGTLPVGSVHTIGRTIVWNTVAQYQVARIFWPEVEVNASYFHLGPNNGKSQTFVTPGLMVSRIKLRKDPRDRLGLVFGGGMQIATSTYHAYDHGLVLTGRLTF
ncbi:MAG TPA: hypothetical protein VMU57_15845 [Edaphobacter sp.]|uniref:hypothetical protein n=1 Tax=Edaphobacter sp. TaxID=1934404 RepID=UPI002CB81D8F|nr:hypothetical protein [Edaphobacter sp.]HUZ96376.1 hypothetical protein [Edaphobacter sp.]